MNIIQPTPYAHVNDVLQRLSSRMQAILGDKLVGLYLYGSLTTGDYDDARSDIDLLAALTDDLNDVEFDALQQMHHAIVQEDDHWYERIEIAYLSLEGLQTYKTQRSPMGIISPGEAFHMIDAGDDWLMNWYLVLEYGVTLLGEAPQTIIAPASLDEFIEAVRESLTAWREWVEAPHEQAPERGKQAYAILTMCRALYTIEHHEHISKIKAAAWVQTAFPEWAALIDQALIWRKSLLDGAATLPESKRFVRFAIEHIQQKR